MNRSPFRFAALVLAAASLSAPAQASDAPRFALGKAGVSYEQYRLDAYECAEVGLGTDIADTEPVERLRSASQRMEMLDARQESANSTDPIGAGINHAREAEAIRAAARPEQQVKAVKEIIFAAAQRCMAERGYTRFALTEDQRAEMSELGKDEGRAYLHRLASDAAVLEQQKQPLPG